MIDPEDILALLTLAFIAVVLGLAAVEVRYGIETTGLITATADLFGAVFLIAIAVVLALVVGRAVVEALAM